MSGKAKVNVLLHLQYETDSAWEEDLIEGELNNLMHAQRSVTVHLLELDEDLRRKPNLKTNNWMRINGIWHGDDKSNLTRIEVNINDLNMNPLTYISVEQATTKDDKLCGLKEVIETG
jgi:hypothetical protein